MNQKAPFTAMVILAIILSAVGFVVMSRAGIEIVVLWQAGVAHLLITALLNRGPRPSLGKLLASLGKKAYPAHASGCIVLISSALLGWLVSWKLGAGLAILAVCAWASNTVALYRASESDA